MIRIGAAIALAGVACFTGFAMATGAAAEGCSQWDVFGHWDIVQSNGFGVRMDLTQDYPTGEIYGNASYFSPGSGTVNGTVHGWIRGDVIELDTSWGGIYTGSVTFDRASSLIGLFGAISSKRCPLAADGTAGRLHSSLRGRRWAAARWGQKKARRINL